ncbi:MAG: GAF domain-containing protein [Deltaproteobacteria bacterium]|nr:GAF domain-containing protein [Deltaproteobacteria bacterium]
MEHIEIVYERTLQEIQEAVYSTFSLQEILALVVEKTTLALKIPGCSLFVLGEDGEEIKAMASHGLGESYLNEAHVRADRSISETFQGKAVLITDGAEGPPTQYPQAAKRVGTGPILSLPLCVNQKVIGVLVLYSGEEQAFSNEAINFVKTLSEKCIPAIQNARLYDAVADRHETITNDVWKWFRVDAVLQASGPSAVQSLPTAKRQIRL